MTEDEAKTKWCFHFTASHTNPRQRQWTDADNDPATSSLEPTGAFLHHCIASECMAWRLTDAPRQTARNYEDAPFVELKIESGRRVYPDGWGYTYTDTDRAGRKFDLLHRVAADTAPHGYCGLAGGAQ